MLLERVLDGSMTCQIRVKKARKREFTAQVRRFASFAVFFAVRLGLAFRGWCFGVVCGCDIGICVSGRCFEDVFS